MSDDEYQMRLIERRNRERLKELGVRRDPVQQGFLPREVNGGVEQSRYYGKKTKRRRK